MDTTRGPRPTDLPHLPTDARRPRRRSVRSSLRRGLGAAGAAVAVAFVGTAGIGAAQAQAAGVERGLTYAADTSHRPHPPRHAAHPTTLPPATTTAVRYTFDAGRLIEL
ncbi:hypothetical protein [Intrasporangium sp. YIM S08009]|uniref:hypothetical protein n=1 Tax=Intrasporangium zincisolvens TaxID=3080018 RepID=UPI002B06194D|nr:hypothetical protein [Intrasporangium sp. YIM S08009]